MQPRCSPALAWHDPRVHLLDDSWLLTIFAVLFATAIPWLVSGLAIDFVGTARGAARARRASTSRSPRWRARRAQRTLAAVRALTALHALGVLVVAFVWQHAGGLQNPLFLMVFALPVIGSIFLSRWQPYLMALLAAVAVALIAAIQAPELRWYAPGLNDGRRLAGESSRRRAAAPRLPFAGLLCAVGVLRGAAGGVRHHAVRLRGRRGVPRHASSSGSHTQVGRARGRKPSAASSCGRALLEQLPLPAFLLDANTAEVICASSAALAKFDDRRAGVQGRSFFDGAALLLSRGGAGAGERRRRRRRRPACCASASSCSPPRCACSTSRRRVAALRWSSVRT